MRLRTLAADHLWHVRREEVAATFGTPTGTRSGIWLPLHWARVHRVRDGACHLGESLVARAGFPPAHLSPVDVAAIHESLFSVGDPVENKLRSADEAVRRLDTFGAIFDEEDRELVHEGVMATLHGERVGDREISAIGNEELMGANGGAHQFTQVLMAEAPHVALGQPRELHDGMLEYVSRELERLPESERPQSAAELDRLRFDPDAFGQFVEERRTRVLEHISELSLPGEPEAQRSRNAAAWEVLREYAQRLADVQTPGEALRETIQTAVHYERTNRMVGLPPPPQVPRSPSRPRLALIRGGWSPPSHTDEVALAATDVVYEDGGGSLRDFTQESGEGALEPPRPSSGPRSPGDDL